MDELALPEALQAEHLVVRLQRIFADPLVGLLGGKLADQLADLVGGCVLVQLIQVVLQELTGLGQAQGVKPAYKTNFLPTLHAI